MYNPQETLSLCVQEQQVMPYTDSWVGHGNRNLLEDTHGSQSDEPLGVGGFAWSVPLSVNPTYKWRHMDFRGAILSPPFFQCNRKPQAASVLSRNQKHSVSNGLLKNQPNMSPRYLRPKQGSALHVYPEPKLVFIVV